MQHGQPTEAAELERKRKNAMLLLSKGLISKAVRCINSYGIGNLDDPNVVSQMKAKYPSRSDQLPLSVTKGQCIDNLVGLREALLDLSPGVSPGTGGMRPEFLISLAEVWEDWQMEILEQFGIRYQTYWD